MGVTCYLINCDFDLRSLNDHWASQVVLVVKNPPANAEGTGDAGLIPGSERPPGGGNGNPLQYSCLENSMDRGVWWAQSREPQRVGHDRATEHTQHTEVRDGLGFLRFYFLAPPRDIQDLSSPTRDQTHILSSGSAAS